MTNLINITVVYSPAPREVQEKSMVVRSGNTVFVASIAASPTCWTSLWLKATQSAFGAKKHSPSHVLEDQDRIEIYRPP
ncbi:MAG: RnfH family protein [Burkholderiaceae bacterium]